MRIPLLLALITAGCIEIRPPSGESELERNPRAEADTSRGLAIGTPNGSRMPVGSVELVAGSQAWYHSGAVTYTLYPNATDPGLAPVSCRIHRGSTPPTSVNDSHPGDSCRVVPGRYTVRDNWDRGNQTVPWTLEAHFGASGARGARSVVAIDAAGGTIGVWAGKIGPFSQFATE